MSEREPLDAIDEGDASRITALLDGGHDPNESQPDGWNALMRAAQRGDADLVRRLLAAGADPNRHNDYGASALTFARGEKALVAVLDGKPSLDARLHALRSMMVLNIGAWAGRPIAESLPDAERDLALRGIELMEATRMYLRGRLAEFLEGGGADLGPVVACYSGLALIHGGGCLGIKDTELAQPRRLLELGANPNDQIWGRSPLKTAIGMHHPKFVTLLLDAGLRHVAGTAADSVGADKLPHRRPQGTQEAM